MENVTMMGTVNAGQKLAEKVQEKYALSLAVVSWMKTLFAEEAYVLPQTDIEFLKNIRNSKATKTLRKISGDVLGKHFQIFEVVKVEGLINEKKETGVILKCPHSKLSLHDTLDLLKETQAKKAKEGKQQDDFAPSPLLDESEKFDYEIVQADPLATGWFKKITKWQNDYLQDYKKNPKFTLKLPWQKNKKKAHHNDAIMAYCNFLKWWMFSMMNDLSGDRAQRVKYLDAIITFIQETVIYVEEKILTNNSSTATYYHNTTTSTQLYCNTR